MRMYIIWFPFLCFDSGISEVFSQCVGALESYIASIWHFYFYLPFALNYFLLVLTNFTGSRTMQNGKLLGGHLKYDYWLLLTSIYWYHDYIYGTCQKSQIQNYINKTVKVFIIWMLVYLTVVGGCRAASCHLASLTLEITTQKLY